MCDKLGANKVCYACFALSCLRCEVMQEDAGDLRWQCYSVCMPVMHKLQSKLLSIVDPADLQVLLDCKLKHGLTLRHPVSMLD